MKSNLFIVGAPKCGTTAWVEYLGGHPDIYFSPIKEPHFFATDLPGRCEVTTRADYNALFAEAGGATILGEASVFYLYSQAAAKEIFEYNPTAKILVFLRNQETMLPSLHHQFLYSFNESIEDFSVAWRLSENRPADTIPPTCREPKILNYAAIGRFDEQLERYCDLFPKSQICVLRFEEWTTDTLGAYRRVLDFLGLKDDGRTNFSTVNEAKHHRSKFLGRMLQHPPSWLLNAVRRIKHLTGRDSIGVGARLERWNRESGYMTRISPELIEEIRHYYAGDRATAGSQPSCTQ